MSKKQTAVRYMIDELTTKVKDIDISDEEWFGIVGQALAMEREQMINFGMTQCTGKEPFAHIIRKQYEKTYNETYGKESE